MKYRFHSLDTAALAALAASTNARMEGTEGEEKRETHSQFAARLGAEMDAAAEKEAKAAKEKGAATEDEPGETDAGADVDHDSPPEEAEGEPDAEAEEEDAGEEDEPGEEGEGEEEGDEDPDEDEDDRPSAEFTRAAGKHDIPTSLEDLPEEARPLVRQRLKAIEKGFTRAMMDQRTYRADERYRKEHPVDFLADILASDPDLQEKVSEELEKRGDATYRESRKIISERDRDKAAREVAKEQRAADTRANRGSVVHNLTRKACERYGIPFGEAVQAAIANIVITSDDQDIDDSEIPKVVKRIAGELGATRRAQHRDERRELVKDKVKDRERAPRVRPGSGRAPRPSAEPGKKLTLEQNLSRTVKEMFPGAD